MSLRNLGELQTKQAEAADSLARPLPTAVRIENRVTGEATLLVDNPLGKYGTRVMLAQEGEVPGLSLKTILAGDRTDGRITHATGKGDVVIFESAFLRGNELVVGRLATRLHDGMEGSVQVMRCLARPTRSSVSKRGAIQFATIVDPSKAAVVRTRDEFAHLARSELVRDWPGGRFGFILRNRQATVEVFADEDGKWTEPLDEFIERLVDTNAILEDGAVEAIPAWTLPMGRNQVIRDVNPKVMTDAVAGPFTRLYAAGRNDRGFLPTLAIITDEEEWAFGGKTGRNVRVVAGMHPLRLEGSIVAQSLPTPRLKVPTPGIRLLFDSKASLDNAARDRKTRRADADHQVALSEQAKAKTAVIPRAVPTSPMRRPGVPSSSSTPSSFQPK